VIKQLTRPFATSPRPSRQERPEIALTIRELDETKRVTDLPLMLKRCLGAVCVADNQSSIAGQLLSNEADDLDRHVVGHRYVGAKKSNRAQLHSEPQTIRITTPPADQLTIETVQHEEPIQLSARRHASETAMTSSLILRKKPDRHRADRNPERQARSKRREPLALFSVPLQLIPGHQR